ncbi:MAG: PBP1A family penicillin-binding protein [bacterium]
MRRKTVAVAIAACFVVVGGIVLYSYFSRDLPSTDDLMDVKPWIRTVLYDINGKPIKSFYEQDRVIVSLDEVPQHVINAFIAVEDRRFYQHWGLNMLAIGKALYEDIVARRIVRGASTITQQLARNLFLTQEQTLTRKIKEAIVAVRIERHYTKDEILQMYLNQIYFGDGAYGVEAAARHLFGKPASDLTLAESALLAGLPRNPYAYSPRRHFDVAKKRQAIVLRSMNEMGMITAAEAAEAKADTIVLVEREKAEPGAYFAEHVRRKLEHDYGASAIYREGLRVYTTLNLDMQIAAEKAVEDHLRRLEGAFDYVVRDTMGIEATPDDAVQTDYIQGALIAIDPSTGYVLAMVGGRDYIESNWNRATQSLRQPGSAFKVFVYTAAIDNGYTPADIIMDDPMVVDMPDGSQWRPKNYKDKYFGPVSLRYALAKSINIPAIKLADRLGQQTVVDYSQRMGISSRLRPYRSIALGSFEVTLLELTSAIGVLAASGIRAEPMTIIRIETRDGEVLERNNPVKTEVLNAQTAYVVTDMLESVVDYGTGASVKWRGLTNTVAGKTGTTDEYTDAWFVGYSPDIVAGVWVGFDAKQTMGEGQEGARVALPIWVNFMKTALEAYPDRPFPTPHGIVVREVCEETGLLATANCPSPHAEVFVSGTEPLRMCNKHYERSVFDQADLLDSTSVHTPEYH